MKKVALMIAIALLATSSFAFADGTALGSNAITTKDGSSIYGGVDAADAARADGVLIGKCSKGVFFRSNYATTGFSAATKHLSGTKAYGTAHNSTAIYFSDIGAASIPSLSQAGNGSFGATWTAM